MSRWPGMLICANSADAPGELQGVAPSGVCPNFRPKRPPVVRAAPPEPPDDGVRYIPLTQGYHAIVDAEDYERVSRYKWCVSRTGNQLYAYRKHRGKSIRMHQFIMCPPKGKVVDHINANGLNNCRSNMRVCTPLENGHNSGPSGRSSRFKGVSYDDVFHRWDAAICLDRKMVPIGSFATEIEAARAYDRVARKLHGEFAWLNFPDEHPPPQRKVRSKK